MKILKDLHTGGKKFSRVERMHFLQELEEELKVYYLSYTAGEVQDVSPKIRMMWKSGKNAGRSRQTRYV